MENPNSFDLNAAIGEWLESHARLPGFKPHNLRELEVHLRDSVAALQAQNLTPEESFMVARHRVGTPEVLAVEFGKVNRHAVWLERAMWMLAGVQLFFLATGLARVTSSLALLFGVKVSVGPATLAVLTTAMYTLTLAGVTFVMWHLIRRRSVNARRRSTRLFRSSSLTAIVIIFAGVLLTFLGWLPTLLLIYWHGAGYTHDAMAMQRWTGMVSVIVPLVFVAIAFAWLAKRHLATVGVEPSGVHQNPTV